MSLLLPIAAGRKQESAGLASHFRNTQDSAWLPKVTCRSETGYKLRAVGRDRGSPI